jgi:hypothetical protein
MFFFDVDVRIGGMNAGTGVIVARSDWEAFVASLTELEKSRRGEAILRGADPRELNLCIYAADRAGHMAIRGEIDRVDLESRAKFSFRGIGFDPTSLPRLVAEMSQVLNEHDSKAV